MVIDFFKPGRSILHRFDPRAKLLMLAVFVSCFFLPVQLWVMAIYLACLVVLIIACLGLAELGRSLAAIAPVLLIICVLTPVFRRGGAAFWSPFGFPLLTSEGLSEALRLLLRFTGLTLSFFIVFRTLDMNDLILALRWFGLPFRVALIIIVSLRFIPSLFVVYKNVQDAHTLRASRGKKAGFFQRTLPVLTSVVIQAIRSIPSLAMALETRGFGRGGRRTEYRILPMGLGFGLSLAAAVLLTALLFLPLLY
ncbi:MAG: energy-coupling factor transporter transmembrane component T [Spirochaetia bacterium]|jgi:energy-coupling factor transport system permease protein